MQARLFKDQEDNTHSIFVNISSIATFIDAELIPKDVIAQKTHPITVRGVSGQKVVDRYVDLPLYISASDGATIIMHTKAYVATDIQAGVLLGMDELGKEEEDIALWLGGKIMQIGGINVPISFTSPGRMPVSFHAYTVRGYPLTKLKISHGEKVGYPHTELHQSPTHYTRPKSFEFTTHKSPTCPQGFARKLHAESHDSLPCHMHPNYSESRELPSYHGVFSLSPTCRRCNASFHSNNALHRHMKVYRHRQRPEYGL